MPNAYCDGKKHIEEDFTTPRRYATDKEAMRARNRRAKELREQGYTVECRSWDFGGLGYGRSFCLHAYK